MKILAVRPHVRHRGLPKQPIIYLCECGHTEHEGHINPAYSTDECDKTEYYPCSLCFEDICDDFRLDDSLGEPDTN